MEVSKREADYICERYYTCSTTQLRKDFNATFDRDIGRSSFYALCHDLGLGKWKEHKYTKEQDDFLRAHVNDYHLEELTAQFNLIFGTKLKPPTIDARCRKSLQISKIGIGDGKFVKGGTPWEHGGMSKEEWYNRYLNSDLTTENWFKKGQESHNAKPINSIAKRLNGTVIKTEDGWMLYHNYIWTQHHGEIPKNHVVIFADGDKDNFDIDNLRLVDMPTFSRLQNNGWLHSGDEILVDAGIAYSELVSAIKERKEL